MREVIISPQKKGHITGAHDEHQVILYALSTCIWCRKTRRLLEDEQVTFDYIYVDLTHGEEREALKEVIRKWNSSISFPTLVIDDEECIVGYKPDKIKETLGL